MSMQESFEKNTRRKISKDRYDIDCVKGLWGVSSRTEDEALREAKHYFQQYYGDGEYDETN